MRRWIAIGLGIVLLTMVFVMVQREPEGEMAAPAASAGVESPAEAPRSARPQASPAALSAPAEVSGEVATVPEPRTSPPVGELELTPSLDQATREARREQGNQAAASGSFLPAPVEAVPGGIESGPESGAEPAPMLPEASSLGLPGTSDGTDTPLATGSLPGAGDPVDIGEPLPGEGEPEAYGLLPGEGEPPPSGPLPGEGEPQSTGRLPGE